jgi:hypothetical protein
MKTIITFLLFFIANYACADETDNAWTVAQVIEESVTISTLAIDWHQTREISSHPGYSERNEILGPYPSESKINRYFGTVIIAQYFIADALPGKWRDGFLLSATLVELDVIEKNKRISLSWKF